MMTAEVLQKGLGTKNFGKRIFAFETIDSTNTCARALASCWAHEGTVVIAEEQTAGKGRLGRAWSANRGENLTFSIVLRPKSATESLSLIPLYAAVAVAEAIEQVSGLRLSCKWPNDLLIGNRKAVGILVEGALKEETVEFVVLGVGVNVNQLTFPEDLQIKATSLALELGRPVDRVKLFQAILRSLESHYPARSKKHLSAVLPEWTERSALTGRHITVSQNGTVLDGIARGIDERGALLLEHAGETTALLAGEVTILDSDGGGTLSETIG